MDRSLGRTELCVRCCCRAEQRRVPTPTRLLLNSCHAHNSMDVFVQSSTTAVQSVVKTTCCLLVFTAEWTRSASGHVTPNSSYTSLKGAASPGWLTRGRAPWTTEWPWHAQLGRCVFGTCLGHQYLLNFSSPPHVTVDTFLGSAMKGAQESLNCSPFK